MVGIRIKRLAKQVSGGYGAYLSLRATGSTNLRAEGSNYLADRARRWMLEREMHERGLRTLSALPLKRNSDKLFILASGESINRLTENDWDLVEAHDLMGLNYSFVHASKPRFHFLELIPDAAMQALLVRCVRDHHPNLEMVFQYKHLSKSGFNLAEYPDPDRMWGYVPDKLSTSSPELFRYLLQRFALRRPAWAAERRLVHHNSHVGAAVMFGNALGYREIVLLGVDLNGGSYFTDSSIRSTRYPPTALYSELNEIRKAYFRRLGEEKLTTHQSMDAGLLKKYGSIDMLDYFRIYQETFPSGPKLYAGCRESLLAKTMPVFPFEGENRASAHEAKL